MVASLQRGQLNELEDSLNDANWLSSAEPGVVLTLLISSDSGISSATVRAAFKLIQSKVWTYPHPLPLQAETF